jgi:multiple sugar transport system permease protein
MSRNKVHDFLWNMSVFLALFIILFPPLWALFWSFKLPKDIISLDFSPQYTVENYVAVLLSKDESIIKGLVDTLILVVLSTVVILPLAFPAAYGLARYRINKIVKWFSLNIFMFVRALPGTAIILPYLQISTAVGLYDTYLIVLLMYVLKFSPLALFMLMTFIGELPVEVEEAAHVDGASTLKVFTNIVIPLIAPGLAATAVFIMIYTWSDYIFVLFLTARNVSNIQLAVARFNAEYYVEWGPLLASSIISILPVILLVALVQKSMIKGLTLGALKG